MTLYRRPLLTVMVVMSSMCDLGRVGEGGTYMVVVVVVVAVTVVLLVMVVVISQFGNISQ